MIWEIEQVIGELKGEAEDRIDGEDNLSIEHKSLDLLISSIPTINKF